MNNESTQHSALICRMVYRWESWRGPADGQTKLTLRHMETCEACREFFAEDMAFEQSLRREALSLRSEPDADLNRRIMQAVQESLPKRTARRVNARSLGFSVAAAVAGVALALVILSRNESEKTGQTLAVNTGETAGGDALTAAASWLGSVDARSSALELVDKNPLKQEIDSVYTDARSVIGFLALNFLPSDLQEPAQQPTRGKNSPHQG